MFALCLSAFCLKAQFNHFFFVYEFILIFIKFNILSKNGQVFIKTPKTYHSVKKHLLQNKHLLQSKDLQNLLNRIIIKILLTLAKHFYNSIEDNFNTLTEASER